MITESKRNGIPFVSKLFYKIDSFSYMIKSYPFFVPREDLFSDWGILTYI